MGFPPETPESRPRSACAAPEIPKRSWTWEEFLGQELEGAELRWTVIARPYRFDPTVSRGKVRSIEIDGGWIRIVLADYQTSDSHGRDWSPPGRGLYKEALLRDFVSSLLTFERGSDRSLFTFIESSCGRRTRWQLFLPHSAVET